MVDIPPTPENARLSAGTWLRALVLTAMAGGMGWGIRGQYGHETGAMIAGTLVGLTVLRFIVRPTTSLSAARTVALTAIGISFGGSMTYGQTIGLTQNANLIGHGDALAWGMLGLAVKGAIWIGYAGVFLGMALGGKRYRLAELTLMLLGMFVLLVLGMKLLNAPFDPANRVLPRIYFSADWHWEGDVPLKPRPECWGGLLFGLLGMMAYAHWVRHDRLARNLGFAGLAAGALGFPLGQCLQAFHAWNPDWFASGWIATIDPYINWWNMMEITFGAVAGGGLAWGLLANRAWIAAANSPDHDSPDDVVLSPFAEVLLCSAHIGLLVAAEFGDFPIVGQYLQYGVILSFLPLLGVLGGRWSPYLMALPIVAIPIAGKTLRELSYRSAEFSVTTGWTTLFVLPIGMLILAAVWLAQDGRKSPDSLRFVNFGLMITVVFYFGWNWVFFRSPWPWTTWTGRTPSGLLFSITAVSLVVATCWEWQRDRQRARLAGHVVPVNDTGHQGKP